MVKKVFKAEHVGMTVYFVSGEAGIIEEYTGADIYPVKVSFKKGETDIMRFTADGKTFLDDKMTSLSFVPWHPPKGWDEPPIPEKKARPMTNAEMRGFIANTLGVEYRHKSWRDDYWEPRLITCDGSPRDWLWRTISPTGEVGEPQEFVVEEEKMNNYDRCIEQLRNAHKIQGNPGNWDYDEYMRGLYNGLELALSIFEERDPIYKDELKLIKNLKSSVMEEDE